MVSSSHEARHRIFHHDPGIFARTFARLGFPFGEPVEVSVLTPDLTELQPLERRVDTLLEIDTADSRGYLLAVESQSRVDAGKRSSWAYYAAYLNAKYKKPPLLVVTCADAATARWAAGDFHIGPPEWHTLTLRPLVLGPHNVPKITDAAVVAEDIPMAAFAAITHSRDPEVDTILEALAEGMKTSGEDAVAVFAEITELGLGKGPAAETWRKLMAIPTSFFRSETSQRLRREGQARALVLVLQSRGLEVSDAVLERIQGCSDAEVLQQWLVRASTAERIEDVFGDEDGPAAAGHDTDSAHP